MGLQVRYKLILWYPAEKLWPTVLYSNCTDDEVDRLLDLEVESRAFFGCYPRVFYRHGAVAVYQLFRGLMAYIVLLEVRFTKG